MKVLILYGSEYGSAKKYAVRFSEMTAYDIKSYDEVKGFSGYDTVILFGALYAGGVKGLKSTLRKLCKNQRLVIATVGLADVCDKTNTDNIDKAISRQVPEDILGKTAVFHLRGGIDYGKLKLSHRIMMSMLVSKVKKIPESERTAEIRAMLDTYGKSVSFVDYGTLIPIADYLKKL